MAYFEYSSIIPAARDEVFEFHRSIENIIYILPDSFHADLMAPAAPLDKGVDFEVKLTRYGVSLAWSGIVEEYNAPESYVDRQVEGPFSLWVHTHKFEEHAAGTV